MTRVRGAPGGDLHVREARDDELPQLLRLWEEAGWGRLTADQWVARHREGPHGPSSVVVAVDPDGRVLGQLTFLRTAVNLRGRTVPASRMQGAILSPEHRAGGGYASLSRHPVIRMLLHATACARSQGVAVAYGLPHPRMLRVVPYLPGGTTAGFPLWSMPLPAAPRVPAGYHVGPAPEPQDVDALWVRCRSDLTCTVRDARTLFWRAQSAPVEVHSVHRGEELVAVVVSGQHGDRQWLLVDLLAAGREAQVAALASVVGVARERADQVEVRKVGVLAVPGLQSALAEVGFTPDDFTFHLLVVPLSPAWPAGEGAPARWYTTPGD
jgi:Acetyltransferase (GNAT) domain